MARDCVTHHAACDCREERFREMEAKLDAAETLLAEWTAALDLPLTLPIGQVVQQLGEALRGRIVHQQRSLLKQERAMGDPVRYNGFGMTLDARGDYVLYEDYQADLDEAEREREALLSRLGAYEALCKRLHMWAITMEGCPLPGDLMRELETTQMTSAVVVERHVTTQGPCKLCQGPHPDYHCGDLYGV